MHVAVTGATGFLGRYVVNRLTAAGHRCRCWHRASGDRGGFEHPERIDWLEGDLSDPASAEALLAGVDAVVHGALYRPGRFFRGGEGDLAVFTEKNVLGSIRLMDHAFRRRVGRFVFISTCAVHEVILEDRPLDEAHPLWPRSHYGAHKAAVEAFVHSFGHGQGYPICALRPTGVYGLNRPIETSKWYDLIHRVARGEEVDSDRGGKEVHVADVARAVEILLTADGVTGQAYNCYDLYVSEQTVAEIARQVSGSAARIAAHDRQPRHQIDTAKLRALGMTFGGRPLLEQTVRELLARTPC